MIDRLAKGLQIAVVLAAFIAALWCIIVATEPAGALEITAAVLVSLLISGGLWGVILCVQDETENYQPVIAPFLEQHLLKPRKGQRPVTGYEQGLAEGRAEARAEIRGKLREQGFDLDKILPPGKGNSDAAGDH